MRWANVNTANFSSLPIASSTDASGTLCSFTSLPTAAATCGPSCATVFTLLELVARRLPAVAERFGDVDAADLLAPAEVGDGAGDAQHAVVAARRQPHRRRGVGEQLACPARRGWRCGRAVRRRLRRWCAPRAPLKRLRLHRARLGDARGDLGAALARRRQGQVGGADARRPRRGGRCGRATAPTPCAW